MGNLNNMNINNIIMNIKNQNMYMLKQIEMNNKILDMIMNNYSQFQKHNNFQPNDNDSNINKLQNEEKNVSITPVPWYTGERFRIIFYSHKKIIVNTPIIMKVSELLNEFLRYFGISEDIEGISFLFDAQKINRKENRTVTEYGLKDLSTIVIVDGNNLMGG